MIRRVFWDWDGTLCDSHEAWDAARCATFRAHGVDPPPSTNDYFDTLGKCGGDYTLAYARYGIVRTAEELNATYEKEFLRQLNTLQLFPGAREALEELETTFRVPSSIITTNTERVFLASYARFPEIHPFFRHLRYDVLNKAGAIRELALTERVRVSRCAYVGDAPSDMTKAREAGAVAVLFLNGYNNGVSFADARPHEKIAQLIDILKLVEQAP